MLALDEVERIPIGPPGERPGLLSQHVRHGYQARRTEVVCVRLGSSIVVW